MPTKTELTPAQLAMLEFLIAQKQENPNWLGEEGPQAFKPVAVATTALLAAVAVAGATQNLAAADKDAGLNVIKNASLDQLLELRKNAIAKK